MNNENLWKSKNFLLTFFGTLVSNIGAVLYSFAVSFYILKITNNDSIMQGTYLTVVGIVTVIFILLGGVFADRFNKVKIIYMCDFIKGGILALSTIIMLFNNDKTFTLIILFIMGVASSVIAGLFAPASNSLIPHIVSRDNLQKANSYFSMLQSLQSIVGILLAGILYSMLPITTLFFVVAGCYIASGISEIFIHYDYKKSEDKLNIKKTLVELGSGFKYIYLHKALFCIFLCSVFINLFFNPVSSNFLPYFISAEVSNYDYLFKNAFTPEMWSSGIQLLLAIGMIIGSIFMSIFKYKKASIPSKISISIMSVLLLILGICYYVLVEVNKMINPMLIIIAIIYFFFGLVIPMINVPLSTTMQKIVDKEMLGKVCGAQNVGGLGLTPLATFLAGIIISASNPAVLLFICAGGFLLTAIIIVTNKSFSKL